MLKSGQRIQMEEKPLQERRELLCQLDRFLRVDN
jgi:hypothetical protein